MSVKKIPVGRRVRLRLTQPFAVAIIIGLAALGAVLVWLLAEFSARDEMRTQKIQIGLLRLATATYDADVARREVLATSSRAARDTYVTAHARVDGSIVELTDATGDQPTQRRRLQRISELMASDRAAVDAVAAGAVPNQIDGAVAEDASAARRGVVAERIRLLMETSEHERLRFAGASAASKTLLALATMGVCILLAVAFWLTGPDRRRRRRTRMRLGRYGQHLQTTNVALRRGIAEATEELKVEKTRAERERSRAEGLLRDVTHRVGNNLAMVVSFINLHIQLSTTPETIKVLTGARQRVHAIAVAQRRLNVIDDLELIRIDTLLENVMAELVEPHTSGAIRIDVRIPPLLAEARAATTMCVLTQELVMNALKHAFPAGSNGLVTVALDTDAAGGAVLQVSDNGRGASPGTVGVVGLGTKIAKLLAAQYDGQITHHSGAIVGRDSGTRVVVTLPGLKLKPDVTDASAAAAPAIARGNDAASLSARRSV